MSFSIFSSKSKRKHYLEEGEPPDKRIETEGDFLIKQLARKQMKIETSLEEQLNTHKEFTKSETLSDVTSHIAGPKNVKDFQKNIEDFLEFHNLKEKGLNDRDIEIYQEYLKLGGSIWDKYKEMSGDALQQRINRILKIVDEKQTVESERKHSRRDEEYLNSLKPQSKEMKLLKFAQHRQKSQLKGPMDELPAIKDEFMESLEKPDLKKIRKKARSLGRKIDSLNANKPLLEAKSDKLDRVTMWDVKDRPKTPTEVIEKKVYTCKPQTLYTISNGQIVQLPKTPIKKLSVEEIRQMPKFANYDQGHPSHVVFLKNLAKNVDEDILRSHLQGCGTCSVKVMNGRMRGQAFIEFDDESHAVNALEILNGLTIENRPIIAQFGKKQAKEKT